MSQHVSGTIDDDATAPLAPVDEPQTRAYVAQVNLLPPEIARQRRHQRIALATLGALALYLLVLGALYIVQLNQVAAARAERDTAAQRVAVLQAEVDGLTEYQALLDDIDAHEELLTTAMDGELSWARVFGDLALAFSRDASLTQVEAVTVADEAAAPGITVTPETSAPAASEPADTDTDAGVVTGDAGTAAGEVEEAQEAVAELTFTGYTVTEFAPGVADVLANFAEAQGFFDSYLATAAEEERGDTEVTTFAGSVDLSEDAYTNRYDDGMPEESLR